MPINNFQGHAWPGAAQAAAPQNNFQGPAWQPPTQPPRQMPMQNPIANGTVGMRPATGLAPAAANPAMTRPASRGPLMGTFKKGGKVKKTGNYKLHAGERVLTAKQAKLAPVALLLRAKKG
jgi:hypothetical protein